MRLIQSFLNGDFVAVVRNGFDGLFKAYDLTGIEAKQLIWCHAEHFARLDDELKPCFGNRIFVAIESWLGHTKSCCGLLLGHIFIQAQAPHGFPKVFMQFHLLFNR